MTVVPVAPMMLVRIWASIPNRVLVSGGIALVIRPTIPVDIAVIPLAAAARHFDDIRHCRGVGLRDSGTSVCRHRGRAQSQGTEQSQNCCTHPSRPSKLHRNNDARSMKLVPGSILTV